MPSFPAKIDPAAAPRAVDRLLSQWGGPFFRGACDFMYDPVRGNRATFRGPSSLSGWTTDPQFFVVPEFLTGAFAVASNAGTTIAPTEITVAGWMNAITFPLTSFIFGSRSGLNIVELGHSTLGGLFFLVNNGNTQFMPGGGFVAGQWYHFAGTFSGGDVALYLDGVPVSSSSGLTMVYPLNQPPALAGRNVNGTPSAGFNGRLFDVRLYSRALFPEEILTLANPVASQRIFARSVTPITPPGPTPPPPNPELGLPPFFRTVVTDQSYTYATSPLVFEQLYNERWDIVANANPLTAELTKNIAGTLVTISKTAIFGNVAAGVPAIWFDLTAAETAGMALGEWKGELIGSFAGTVEVFRKFALFVRS